MRQCHSNTCPVGVCTQDPALRAKFEGTPEKVVNLFTFIGEEVREILASLGASTLDEIVGRTDLLRQVSRGSADLDDLDLNPLLAQADPGGHPRHSTRKGRVAVPGTLDEQIISDADDALEVPEKMQLAYTISNTHRTIGAKLSSHLTRRFGMAGLPPNYFTVSLRGSAGQSLGAWAVQGLKIVVSGDANDYVGKGLSGGTIVLRMPTSSPLISSENTIIGNVVLYGATGGKLFAAGQAGERFCVRNSGARAVVEGCGSNGCEYMTGGIAVILGPVGDNFAAGMTGGMAFVYDPDATFERRGQRRHGGLAANRQHLLGERVPGPGRGAPCRDPLALQRAPARRLDPGDRQVLADLPARDDLPARPSAGRRGRSRDRLSRRSALLRQAGSPASFVSSPRHREGVETARRDRRAQIGHQPLIEIRGCAGSAGWGPASRRCGTGGADRRGCSRRRWGRRRRHRPATGPRRGGRSAC